MHNTNVKKVMFIPTLFIAVNLACNSMQVAVTIPTEIPTIASAPGTAAPTGVAANPTEIPVTATSIPTAINPAVIPTSIPPSADGIEVSTGRLSIILPTGLTNGARGNQYPRTEGANISPWEVTPGHTELKLEGYLLQDKALEPRILVYPAMAYVEMHPAAFESIHRLDNILFGPEVSISDGQFPAVPFFNTKQVFASDIQLISFQNGRGVRFLSEYAQYPASVNNHDLFYEFQGVTNDGAYYIVAILPISAPVLAETSDAGAPLPASGIPYPFNANPNADMQAYYTAITTLLNSTPQESFTPSINQLDSLIQSIRIAQ